MIYINSFDMLQKTLKSLDEDSVSYKIFGNYTDGFPNIISTPEKPQPSKIKIKLLITSSIITFVYREDINYSNKDLNKIKDYINSLKKFECNISIDTNNDKITIN